VLLAIDARNGWISLGFFGAEGRDPAGASGDGPPRPIAVKRVAAPPARSADEYALLFAAFAEGGTVDRAWMSTVVPSLGRELAAACRAAFGVECRTIGPGVKTGIRIRTDIPSEVGSDIVCAAAAAREIAGGPCVVADFDAAVAISGIGASGDLLGVAIAPGLSEAGRSLRASAALIPEVALEGPCRALGKTTAQSVRAGIRLGYAGLVDRIARAQAAELAAAGEAASAAEVLLLATGEEGGEAVIAELGRGRFVPDLALRGIALMAFRASP
jgi:type III pantothenate kinase